MPDFKISGAVQRGVKLRSPEVLVNELESWTMLARPKSVIRAFPDPSTMMLDYPRFCQKGRTKVSNDTHPFEIPMNNITRIEICETIGDVEQLRLR